MTGTKLIYLACFITGSVCSILTVPEYGLNKTWQQWLSGELPLSGIIVCLSLTLAVCGLASLISLELYELFIAYRRARHHERYGKRYK